MKTSRAEIENLVSENYAGDASIFLAAAESFIESVVQSQEEFSSAYAARDAKRLAAVSHRLKGDTSLFHRQDAPELFRKIDQAARAGHIVDRAEVDLALESLTRVIGELNVAIAEYRRA